MTEVLDIEEFLNNIERRIKKCEEAISVQKNYFGVQYEKEISKKTIENVPSNNTLTSNIQNRFAIGQNSLMASLENDIQELNKIKDDPNYTINFKLDHIETIIKKIFSLGPLENWLSTYETIKAYLEMDSADFESSVLTLDLRKVYIMEHFDEFNTIKTQLMDLENLLPFLNQEIDIDSINTTMKKLKEIETKSKRINNETKFLWENLEKLVFSYSNFVYKYNILTINQ